MSLELSLVRLVLPFLLRRCWGWYGSSADTHDMQKAVETLPPPPFHAGDASLIDIVILTPQCDKGPATDKMRALSGTHFIWWYTGVPFAVVFEIRVREVVVSESCVSGG